MIFNFLGCKMSGEPTKIGDSVVYYKVNLQSFKRFLQEKGDKIKLVPLDFVESEINSLNSRSELIYYLFWKIKPLRKIQTLLFYPDAQEIHVGFKKDKSDIMKIVGRA